MEPEGSFRAATLRTAHSARAAQAIKKATSPRVARGLPATSLRDPRTVRRAKPGRCHNPPHDLPPPTAAVRRRSRPQRAPRRLRHRLRPDAVAGRVRLGDTHAPARPGVRPRRPASPGATPRIPTRSTRDRGPGPGLRGLQAKKPVEPEVSTRRARAAPRAGVRADNPPETWRGQSGCTAPRPAAARRRPPGDAPRAAQQPGAGSVRPEHEEDVRHLTGGRDRGGPSEITYAHEYDHALQDQNFDLDPMLEVGHDQSDRASPGWPSSRATRRSSWSCWAPANLTPAELGEVAGAGSDPATQAMLDKMPRDRPGDAPVPVQRGPRRSSGPHDCAAAGPRSTRCTRSCPTRTEQILHPDKYLAQGSRIPVTFPTDLATRLGGTAGRRPSRTRSASSRPMSGSSTSVARRPRRRWTPRAAGAAIAWCSSRTRAAPGRSCSIPPGTRDADQAAFVQAAQGVARKLTTASSFAEVFQRDATSATVIVASSRDAQAKVANVLGLAG